MYFKISVKIVSHVSHELLILKISYQRNLIVIIQIRYMETQLTQIKSYRVQQQIRNIERSKQRLNLKSYIKTGGKTLFIQQMEHSCFLSSFFVFFFWTIYFWSKANSCNKQDCFGVWTFEFSVGASRKEHVPFVWSKNPRSLAEIHRIYHRFAEDT